MAVNLLRLPAVIQRVGYKRTQIYRLVESGTFPSPIKLGPNAIAWSSDEIDAWIADRITASRKGGTK